MMVTDDAAGPQVLLSEWAGDTRVPRLIGSSADREECPACGHPTMDCTHDTLASS